MPVNAGNWYSKTSSLYFRCSCCYPSDSVWSNRISTKCVPNCCSEVPTGSPSRSGDVTIHVCDINLPSLPIPFLFGSCVYFCLYGPFNCISFHKFSWQLSVFSLCFSSLISALLVLSTICLSMKVSFSPDIIFSGWLGSKHRLTN